MRIGVIFPQTEIGTDPAVIRKYAQAVEAMGYQHIATYEHVLGADTTHRPDWTGPYTWQTPFHEPFVLFGHLAAITQQIELATSVLVLPQRQTALVAKQAAEVDVLSGGRLRLGVGVGWNPVEYAALDTDFHTRGARSEEQIALLRALWTQPSVTFHGRWHHIDAAGINPLPVQRPIPIWIGGDAEAALQRAGRLGDGWLPQRWPDEKARMQVERLRTYIRAAGRNERAVGIDASMNLTRVPPARWREYAEGWRALGATHLSLSTMGGKLASIQDHLDLLRRAKAMLEI